MRDPRVWEDRGGFPRSRPHRLSPRPPPPPRPLSLCGSGEAGPPLNLGRGGVPRGTGRRLKSGSFSLHVWAGEEETGAPRPQGGGAAQQGPRQQLLAGSVGTWRAGAGPGWQPGAGSGSGPTGTSGNFKCSGSWAGLRAQPALRGKGPQAGGMGGRKLVPRSRSPSPAESGLTVGVGPASTCSRGHSLTPSLTQPGARAPVPWVATHGLQVWPCPSTPQAAPCSPVTLAGGALCSHSGRRWVELCVWLRGCWVNGCRPPPWRKHGKRMGTRLLC